MFDSDHPWQHLECFGIKDRTSPRHSAAMEVCSAMRIPLVDGLQGVMARELLLEPSQLIWNHHGVCRCGRRTFLFSQCEKCARVEAIERQDEIMDKPLIDEENAVVDPDEPKVEPIPKNDVFFVAPS